MLFVYLNDSDLDLVAREVKEKLSFEIIVAGGIEIARLFTFS
jgi:hypothetical protein